MTKRTYTDEQVAFIRENAPSMSDREMAEHLGVKEWKVLWIRQREGIDKGERGTFWTEARLDLLKKLYIDQGLPSPVVAQRIGDGCYPSIVRRKATLMGWERDPEHRARNSAEARQARNTNPRPPRPSPKPRAEPAKPRRPASLPDNVLIAEFIAKRGVTVCAPGVAAGLSSFEREFWVVGAAGSWKAAHEARKAAEGQAAA